MYKCVCVKLKSLANMRTKPATHLIQIESKLTWNMKGGERKREGRKAAYVDIFHKRVDKLWKTYR